MAILMSQAPAIARDGDIQAKLRLLMLAKQAESHLLMTAVRTGWVNTRLALSLPWKPACLQVTHLLLHPQTAAQTAAAQTRARTAGQMAKLMALTLIPWRYVPLLPWPLHLLPPMQGSTVLEPHPNITPSPFPPRLSCCLLAAFRITFK